ncbi:MAG TPA: 50S ribosomal protein L18 [Gammaproteobacteria bacterium]|jgi:large subunit ribosomal protein L18|nr:50S ribosomal protein L18 [Arenicellales bacterium]MDP6948565.1 50S ribosomal protein L18 [Arenicellales bacterium]HCY13572.1 50S ribosomal protein L18 [Gammaproteobacteria bacterium]|tara:strand:+ start:9277 stop:9633 length:357 start_codon:yes stop_codon:yes gene_type:complete
MSDKKAARLKRATKTRSRIRGDRAHRLCVYRTPRHIYAQVIDPSGGQVLASASTLEPEFRKEVVNGGNVVAAGEVGKRIADRAKAAGIVRVAFDRSGYKYHGRIKAMAEAAREGGLDF